MTRDRKQFAQKLARINRVSRSSRASADEEMTLGGGAPGHMPEQLTVSNEHSQVLRSQQLFGNGHVRGALQSRANASHKAQATIAVSRRPESAPLTEIAAGARNAKSNREVTLALAGSPAKKDPPDGMTFIANQSTSTGLGGKPAGFTAIQSAAAFTPPALSMKTSVEKDGYKRHHFAEVEPTTATDVAHASFYPAPGTHDYAISKRKGETYTYFWSISEKISELIRKGEQEHLNDAQRAFDLTYGLIANEINAMVGTKFGPADTPAAAEKLAEAELAKRLPAVLGTNPTTWFKTLDIMLKMTTKRDLTHLHDVIPGDATIKGKTFYVPLIETDQTNVDHVPSAEIVIYPTAGAKNPAPAAQNPSPATPSSEEKGK